MTGMRKAVNDKCKDCSYANDDSGAGSWRNQVLHCSVPSCALYPFRPMPVGFKYRNDPYLKALPNEA